MISPRDEHRTSYKHRHRRHRSTAGSTRHSSSLVLRAVRTQGGGVRNTVGAGAGWKQSKGQAPCLFLIKHSLIYYAEGCVTRCMRDRMMRSFLTDRSRTLTVAVRCGVLRARRARPHRSRRSRSRAARRPRRRRPRSTAPSPARSAGEDKRRVRKQQGASSRVPCEREQVRTVAQSAAVSMPPQSTPVSTRTRTVAQSAPVYSPSDRECGSVSIAL